MLSASHLTRSFGARAAVQDVSFELAPGEIFGLLGPNGGGKTTTLRMLAGLIAPSSGEVRIDGIPVNRDTSARLRRRIGFLTEAPGLWDRFTVRQTLLVYARLHELEPPDRAVDRTLELLEIRDRAHDPTAQLSKGLKQRVALARALLHEPEVLLLDEPTAGLDPESARGVRELILSLRHERRTVILSTHNLDEVERVADRVAVLRSRLIALDTPAGLRRRLFGARVRVVLSQPAGSFQQVLSGSGDVTVDGTALSVDLARASIPIPELVRRLVEAGAEIQSVTQEKPPLEEVYLKLIHLNLAALQVAVCVSSRVDDERSAQAIGSLVAVPIAVLLVAPILGVDLVTMPIIVGIAAVLVVVNAGLIRLGIAVFDRESILTRWK